MSFEAASVLELWDDEVSLYGFVKLGPVLC